MSAREGIGEIWFPVRPHRRGELGTAGAEGDATACRKATAETYELVGGSPPRRWVQEALPVEGSIRDRHACDDERYASSTRPVQSSRWGKEKRPRRGDVELGEIWFGVEPTADDDGISAMLEPECTYEFNAPAVEANRRERPSAPARRAAESLPPPERSPSAR